MLGDKTSLTDYTITGRREAVSEALTPIKFGTDGWRAIIAREFTFANVERVAQAYADYLAQLDRTALLGSTRRGGPAKP